MNTSEHEMTHGWLGSLCPVVELELRDGCCAQEVAA
jgi:hypothetical protein